MVKNPITSQNWIVTISSAVLTSLALIAGMAGLAGLAIMAIKFMLAQIRGI